MSFNICLAVDNLKIADGDKGYAIMISDTVLVKKVG